MQAMMEPKLLVLPSTIAETDGMLLWHGGVVQGGLDRRITVEAVSKRDPANDHDDPARAWAPIDVSWTDLERQPLKVRLSRGSHGRLAATFTFHLLDWPGGETVVTVALGNGLTFEHHLMPC